MKISDVQIFKENESNDTLIQMLKNNLVLDHYLIAQFDQLISTVQILNEFETLKEHVNKSVQTLKSTHDIDAFKKKLGISSDGIDLNSILDVIQNIVNDVIEKKDIQRLSLQQKQVYTNEVALEEIKKNYIMFGKLIQQCLDMYIEINQISETNDPTFQYYMYSINSVIKVPEQSQIYERNQKMKILQMQLKSLPSDGEPRIVIEAYLSAIQTYDSLSIYWNDFKKEFVLQ
jgi:hypothetical protein